MQYRDNQDKMQITDKGEKNVFVHDLNRVFLSNFSLGLHLSSGCCFWSRESGAFKTVNQAIYIHILMI